MLDEQASRARRTYNAAADHYDGEPLGFWARVGARTVDRIALGRGAHVLDAPCGSGASALAAAAKVGCDGQVVAVDLAERLLSLGRAKAAVAGLTNIEFRAGDLRDVNGLGASFDAVICVFGIFFVDDMDAQVRRFYQLLRPGGTLAITTWGPGIFAPGDAAFWNAIAAVRPDLVRRYNPWDALTTEDAVRDLFTRAGTTQPETAFEQDEQPLRSPEDFWAIALGSGYRGTLEALNPTERNAVRTATLNAIGGIRAVGIPVIYATTTRPTNSPPVEGA